MIKEAKYKMSEERFNQLKEELIYLQTVREKEVAQQIKEARSFGDLTENSEYDEAKTEQSKLYAKISEISNLIENAEIVVKANEQTDIVGMGSKVRIKPKDAKDNDATMYEIVGSQDADPAEFKISDDSPLGRELMEKKKGDIVTVDAPVGTLMYEILAIE